MRFWMFALLGLAASAALFQTARAGGDANNALQRIERQMSRLGIQGGTSDVSCSDWMAAWTEYQAYMNSHPDDAEAKQVSGQEPNIPAVATLAEAESEAELHFNEMNNVRTGNGLEPLSPTGGFFSLQEAVPAVCKDASNSSVPHTLAFAAYAAFAAAAGDLGPLEALNDNEPASPFSFAPDASTVKREQDATVGKSYPGAPLTSAERDAITDDMRECWTIDSGAEGVQNMQVLLTVTTDATGTVRLAQVASADQGRVAADPVFRAFAERAVRAVLDYRCSALPLPPPLEGRSQTLTILFSP
jgi:hypothetical protein